MRFSNNTNLIFTVKKTEKQIIKELVRKKKKKELVTGSEPLQPGFRANIPNQQALLLLDTDTQLITQSMNTSQTTLKKYWIHVIFYISCLHEGN